MHVCRPASLYARASGGVTVCSNQRGMSLPIHTCQVNEGGSRSPVMVSVSDELATSLKRVRSVCTVCYMCCPIQVWGSSADLLGHPRLLFFFVGGPVFVSHGQWPSREGASIPHSCPVHHHWLVPSLDLRGSPVCQLPVHPRDRRHWGQDRIRALYLTMKCVFWALRFPPNVWTI